MRTPINPFILSPETSDLKELYPDSSSLKDIYTKINFTERLGIIRLWMTEGIPYAFKEHPLLYEEIRDFIAKGVNVHTKDVTIVGSARIGYSLSKDEWGRLFNNKSDFDFTIVSNDLYKTIVNEFQKWVKDLELKRISPKDFNEMSVWLNNIKYLDKKIPTGFIQLKFIPYHPNYSSVKKCYDTIWLLKKKLEFTHTAPRVSDASIRIYSSWKACINQLRINFNSALNLWSK